MAKAISWLSQDTSRYPMISCACKPDKKNDIKRLIWGMWYMFYRLIYSFLFCLMLFVTDLDFVKKSSRIFAVLDSQFTRQL